MEVNVEWSGKNKAGTVLHKSSDTDVSDMFDRTKDLDKIKNILKKDIAAYYEVDRDSVNIIKVNFKEDVPQELPKDSYVGKPIEIPVKDEYENFIDKVNGTIDIKIAEITNEIKHLTELKIKFENLKKKVNE